MIKITCTHCQKPLSLDETKLPMKEVSFPCPVCKTKITVDRRNFGAGATPSAAPAPPPPEEVEDDDADDHANEVGAKAFIIGADNQALRQAAKLVGYLPVHFAAADQARDRFMQDTPHVVMLNPSQVTPPPLETMQPILSLMAADRRKSFFVLFADGLRTLDGNAAFLYGVNLVVANKDVPTFPEIFREAFRYHERLYAVMNSVLRQRAEA